MSFSLKLLPAVVRDVLASHMVKGITNEVQLLLATHTKMTLYAYSVSDSKLGLPQVRAIYFKCLLPEKGWHADPAGVYVKYFTTLERDPFLNLLLSFAEAGGEDFAVSTSISRPRYGLYLPVGKEHAPYKLSGYLSFSHALKCLKSEYLSKFLSFPNRTAPRASAFAHAQLLDDFVAHRVGADGMFQYPFVGLKYPMRNYLSILTLDENFWIQGSSRKAREPEINDTRAKHLSVKIGGNPADLKYEPLPPKTVMVVAELTRGSMDTLPSMLPAIAARLQNGADILEDSPREYQRSTFLMCAALYDIEAFEEVDRLLMRDKTFGKVGKATMTMENMFDSPVHDEPVSGGHVPVAGFDNIDLDPPTTLIGQARVLVRKLKRLQGNDIPGDLLEEIADFNEANGRGIAGLDGGDGLDKAAIVDGLRRFARERLSFSISTGGSRRVGGYRVAAK